MSGGALTHELFMLLITVLDRNSRCRKVRASVSHLYLTSQKVCSVSSPAHFHCSQGCLSARAEDGGAIAVLGVQAIVVAVDLVPATGLIARMRRGGVCERWRDHAMQMYRSAAGQASANESIATGKLRLHGFYITLGPVTVISLHAIGA